MMSTEKRFRLIEKLATENQGRPLWFARMTGIGPMTTPDEAEAATFASREDAARCPAMFHALSCYELEEVPGE